MATVDKPQTGSSESDYFDEDGLPWLENGERMDQETFHERYLKLPPNLKAELIGGIVYVMASPSLNRHGRSDARVGGWLFNYCVATPGTEVQDNTTAILGPESEPQPDSALLILPEYGGQTRLYRGYEDYTYGAPELVAEIAVSSRSIDLSSKLADYEKAGVREYFVLDVRGKAVHWFERVEGHFAPIPTDDDGLIRSRFFPGLWLDPGSLLKNDKVRLIQALNLGLASPEHAAFVAELRRKGPTVC
jgi:Putative restriction endonuclease